MKPKSTARISLPLVSAIAALLGSQHTHAVDRFWEGNASATWASNVNWTNSATALNVGSVTPLAADDVFFSMTSGGGTGTGMSLNTAAVANSITFRQTQNFTIQSNTGTTTTARSLTIGAGGITKTATSGIFTINGNNTNPLTVALASSSSQTWSNASTTTALNIGTTFISGTNTAAIVSLGANTLTLDGAGNFNFGAATTSNAVITGATGSLIKNGAGTLTIGGANTFGGAVTVNAGTLALASNGAAGTSAGGITLAGSSAATLQINAGITTADNITFSNTNATSSVKRNIAASGAYTTGTSGNLKSSFVGGTPDTTAQILAGTSSSGSESTLTMSFAQSSAATNDGIRRSDVFTTAGTSSDTYVLSLTGGLAADSFLARLDDSTNSWIAAGTNLFAAAYDSATHVLGDYGFDSANNSVWAVVNYGDSFAAIPEPTSALAGLLLGAGLLRRKRNTVR